MRQVLGEISELKSQHCELNYELGPLQKFKKSSWYFQRSTAKPKAEATTHSHPGRNSSEPVEESDPVTDVELSGLDDDKESGMNDI